MKFGDPESGVGDTSGSEGHMAADSQAVAVQSSRYRPDRCSEIEEGIDRTYALVSAPNFLNRRIPV
jgi:hypothetical protein